MRRFTAAGLLALLLAAAACSQGAAEKKAALLTGGDPARGKIAIRERGCGSCHTVPGVPGANALAGPPLEHMASRAYVAGMLPNTPANMRTWIMHPQAVKTPTAMPDVGLDDATATDIVAYLYTLE
ncbi:MAG: hypothetical protein JWP97_1594 [Labilithrix sp.]|nr:hypothetical protein [Labilithrix sp.]